MKVSFKLTPKAKEDIWEIWNYTVIKWGEPKADEYTKKIYKRCQWLADNQNIGISRDEIKPGYRSYPEGKHIIFYRIVDNEIQIIGVPHQSEDINNMFD